MYLEVNDLCKSYGEGGSYTQVLKNVSLEVQQGDMCVIQGTSGSGKSTLLNCIGGLDTVDSAVDATLRSVLTDAQDTLDQLSTFRTAIHDYTSAVEAARDGSAQLRDGVQELQNAADDILDEYFSFDLDNLTQFRLLLRTPASAARRMTWRSTSTAAVRQASS